MEEMLDVALTLLDDHQVLQHVEGVAVGLHGDHAVLLAVHLEEAVVVQAHHLGLQSVFAPEMHPGPAKGENTREPASRLRFGRNHKTQRPESGTGSRL